jgi:hypothetical protein
MLLQSEIACLHAAQFCGSLILHFVVSLPAYFIAFSSFSVMKLQHQRQRSKNSLTRYTYYYERWAFNQTICSTDPVAVISLSQILNPCHYFSYDIHNCTLPCLGRAAATPSHAAHSLCRRCL